MVLRFARSRMARWCVGWMFENLSSILPVDRLYETPRLVAFHHPEPVHPIHILIVPKKAVKNISELAETGSEFAPHFMEDLLNCVRKLVEDFALERSGYRLIVNGGSYQDVPELHFHLVSGVKKD